MHVKCLDLLRAAIQEGHDLYACAVGVGAESVDRDTVRLVAGKIPSIMASVSGKPAHLCVHVLSPCFLRICEKTSVFCRTPFIGLSSIALRYSPHMKE